MGAIVKIPLGNGWHSYGQILDEPEIAFFDLRTETEPSSREIAGRPILFRLWVMNYAVTSGRWLKVGTAQLSDDLRQPVPRFKQDPIDPAALSIYLDEKETPASPEECANLERAAVWDPEHVEDRLRDHFAGRPNKWVESLSLRRGT